MTMQHKSEGVVSPRGLDSLPHINALDRPPLLNGALTAKANYPGCPTKPPPQSENPDALAGATGAGIVEEQHAEDTLTRLARTRPIRHARVATALFASLGLLRHGREHAEELAAVLADALGPRELLLIADAAGIALRHRLEPEL